MKSLIIYESKFGNTAKLAEKIAETLGSQAVKADKFEEAMLEGVELLIVGSPVWAWNIAAPVKKILKIVEAKSLQGVKGGAFDTGFANKLAGNACKKIDKKLRKAGLDIVLEPMHFIVDSDKGPLKEREIERAINWVRNIH